MQSKLKEIVDNYIEEYRKLKDLYEDKYTKCELYKTLLACIKDGEMISDNKFYIVVLLNSIYNDQIYEKEFYDLFYRLESGKYNNKNEIRSYVSIINRDYNNTLKETENLRNRINRIKHVVSSARRAKLAFEYNNAFDDTKYIVGDLRKIIDYYGASGVLSDKEVVLCINDLDFYNRNVTVNGANGNKREKEYASRLYNEIPDILNAGYEVVMEAEVDISRRGSLNRVSEEIFNTLKYIDKDKILEFLEGYEKYDLENNEYNYIIARVLNGLCDELISYYELLLDKEAYSKIGNRKEIIKDYYITLNKYLVVRDYYNKINEIVIDEEDTVFTEEETKELEETKRLIYSTSLANPTKARFLSDMDDITKENYSTIYGLLNNFINGTNAPGEVKRLSNNKRSRGFYELKNDQVRIVYKHIRNNIYNVFGVFVKKANNDITMYQTMFSRMVSDVSMEDKLTRQLELGNLTNKQIGELVSFKGRKGNR